MSVGKFVFGCCIFVLVIASSVEAKVTALDVMETVDLYGSFRAHVAYMNDSLSIENNASRFGLNIVIPAHPYLSILGRAEWSVNLVNSDGSLNVEESTEGGMGVITSDPGSSPFGTRLGYVGLGFGPAGTVLLGKQWGVYYDVAKWTDKFIVFGAQGNSVFNAGTDGGYVGVGRAQKALSYRLELMGIKAGMQVQFRDFDDSRPVNSVGGIFSYELPMGLSAGIAYNHSLSVNRDELPEIEGYDGGDFTALVAGMKFEKGPVYLAGTFAWTNNMEMAEVDDFTVVYDTWGLEAYASYMWLDRVGFHALYNRSQPRNPSPRLSDDFVLSYVGAGLTVHFTSFALLYVEAKLNASRNASGIPLPSVGTVGLKLDFSSLKMVEQFSRK